ncbi:MAG: PAS domain S-box protein [Cyclobacteriaceae bacterium]|nr:PAS domain S-box protein [Cyclobacteriaceae bacterium]
MIGISKIPSTKPFRLFAFGFGVILALIIVIQIALQHSYDQTVDPALINKSGRQRMISQRVTKLTLYLQQGIKPDVADFSVTDSLLKYTSVLEDVHAALLQQNLKEVKSKKIDSLLRLADPFVFTLANGSRALIGQSKGPAMDSIISEIADAEVHLLALMEQVTKQFERKSVEELNLVRRTDQVFSIALGVAIIFLFVILFFPVLRRLEKQNKVLREVRDSLSRQKILMRTIIDNIPINIYAKDKNSRKTLANKQEWTYTGAKSEAEVLGRNDFDLFPGASAEVSVAEDQEVLNGNPIIERETFNFKTDGTERWFLVSKVPLREEGGTITGLVGVSIDITERKRISTKLESALKEAHDLYDNAPCGYHTVDGDGIITRMNATELRWLGYKSEEVVNKLHVKDLLTPRGLILRERIMERIKQERHVDNIEVEFIRKDGSIMDVILNTAAVFDEDGKVNRNRSTVYDNTESKRLQNEILSANEKLTQLNVEKNSFMAMATHDLKNPLNSISGLTTLLKMEPGLSQDGQDLADMIEKSSTRMRDLITRLLDYNRIDQGKTEANPKEMNLLELLSRRIDSFREQSKQKNIKLQLSTKVSKEGAQLVSDPELLDQVFDNLISNALKFSKSGTAVDVRLRHSGNHFVVEVADQGQGIRAEEMPKLFLPFTKLSNKPTGNETSSGLGMSIVKQLLELLGGSISAESEVGKGTTFRVAIKSMAD